MSTLATLGEEIVTINRANGWNVCQPDDWNPNAYDAKALDRWQFEEPHFVDSEDCMGNPEKYWRVWARNEAGKFKAGCGLSKEQAIEDLKAKILKDPEGYKIPAVLALITSEVSEALEAFRKRDRANFEEELADVLIRVLDCSHGLGIDMETVVRAKLEANRQRGFRHGGKAL